MVSVRQSRLRNAGDFNRVFARARRSSDRLFTVLYCRNELRYPRLGLAIAKRRVRLAVGRNRLKRLIRESFLTSREALAGVDVVVMARDSSDRASNPEIFASLSQHWARVAAGAKEETKRH